MSGESKLVAVRDGSKERFRIESYEAGEGTRWLVFGPTPGRFLFDSSPGTFREAVINARMRWAKMDRTRRDKWYGVKGIFTTFKPPKDSV